MSRTKFEGYTQHDGSFDAFDNGCYRICQGPNLKDIHNNGHTWESYMYVVIGYVKDQI